MPNPAFASTLNSLQDAWAKAEAYSHWEPPVDGQYTWRCTDVDRRKSDKEGYLMWALKGTLDNPNDPELNGKEWRAFFFTSKFMGFMKEVLITAFGEAPVDINAADAALDRLVGGLYVLDLATRIDNKGITRRNASIVRVLEVPAS